VREELKSSARTRPVRKHIRPDLSHPPTALPLTSALLSSHSLHFPEMTTSENSPQTPHHVKAKPISSTPHLPSLSHPPTQPKHPVTGRALGLDPRPQVGRAHARISPTGHKAQSSHLQPPTPPSGPSTRKEPPVAGGDPAYLQLGKVFRSLELGCLRARRRACG